mmetsp:Transcript_39598/g.118871  ORF Transcript_39598/g.118871 Transcript_39598/m.118871 type:complete len:260 (+) Transcript_39598:459-1238(+)
MPRSARDDLALDLAQYARNRQGHARPPLGAQLVSLGEDAQQDRKDLSRRGDRRAHQRIEVRNGVKDEGLSHGAASREPHHQRQYLGMGRAVRHSGGEFAQRQRDEGRDAHHVQVGPEHEIVRLGLDPHLSQVGLEPLLDARGDTVHGEGEEDEEQAQGRRLRFAPLLLSQTQCGSPRNDRGDLHVLPHIVPCAPINQLSGHDGGHLPGLRQGRYRKAQSGRQRRTRKRLGGDLGRAADREEFFRNAGGTARDTESDVSE